LKSEPDQTHHIDLTQLGDVVRTVAPLRRSVEHIDIDQLISRLGRVVPEAEIAVHLALIRSIEALKTEKDAVIVAHNHQTPLIAAGVADFVGDSLAMPRYAAQCTARLIVVCGVHFMAETVKLRCPNKRVLLPNLRARCSLADSIDADYVRSLRQFYPGLPLVAYVNIPAAVKAEAAPRRVLLIAPEQPGRSWRTPASDALSLNIDLSQFLTIKLLTSQAKREN